MPPQRRLQQQQQQRNNNVYWIVAAVAAVPAFFLGTTVALWIVELECPSTAMLPSHHHAAQVWLEGQIQQRIAQERKLWESQQQQQQNTLAENTSNNIQKQQQPQPFFPADTMGRFAVGLARTPKANFTRHLDLGVPVDLPSPGASDVLLLYSHSKALPDGYNNQKQEQNDHTDEDHSNVVPPQILDSAAALQHCDYLNVILTDRSGSRKQCVAIVPQYESYHVQKWMRLDDDQKTGKLATKGNKGKLQMVSRGHQANGRDQFHPPGLEHARKNWDLLQRYLQNLDAVLAELREILPDIANDQDNTVIVMVCNFGQAELLMNFVCAAQSRGLDLSNVLVFTTDPETTDLATSLGLHAYYDHRNFGDIPAEAAKRYGDRKFVAMMMAKVICVQLVSMLGYNFLFQDVDIVWIHQNPLEYFRNAVSAHDDDTKKYDIYFQDDGGHSIRYAPYSANSGFYFVRHNERTRHFLTSLLMAGDLILKTDSHQQALIALLAEHVSLYGLKAKVLSRDTVEFPGGYHFHQKSGQYMRQYFAGEIEPYIFHMSWTLNKDNKLLFFRQMGEWYVQDKCIGKKVAEIDGGGGGDLRQSCCSAEALVSCHYRDKPSKIPCKDSPPIDKGRPSFW